MSEHGATASYRGYRLQALYILIRILDYSHDNEYIFIPEGIEDLAIQESDVLIETVQVKSYDGLTLSNLSPTKKGSFFHRAIEYIQQESRPTIRIDNVGLTGPELHDAWEGEKEAGDSITKKMTKQGFTSEQIQLLFNYVELISLDEENLENQALMQLQKMVTGVDPENAFDLLHKWLFDLSETRTPLSANDLLDKVNSVGKFLAERAHHHKEWFTNIIPIEDQTIDGEQKKALQEEFYAGASTRYEHILAELK